MGRTIDKNIKHGNHLPGTERYTRPEEVKALSKFLKEGISERDKNLDILQDNLEVPQDGRPGSPMYKEVQDLSRTVETIDGNRVKVNNLGKDRIGLTKNPDPELGTEKLKIKGNDNLEKLEDKKLLISGNEDPNLSEKRLDLSPEEIKTLETSKLQIKGNTDLDNLSEKKLQIDGKEIEELGDKRLGIKSKDIETLSETRLDIEEPELNNLSEKRLDISAPENNELSNTILTVEKKSDPKLEKESLKIKEKKIGKLSEEALKLSGIKDQKLAKEPELVPGKIEDIKELSKGALQIKDKPVTKLSEDVERISPKEIKGLENTRLDLEEKDVELSEEILKLKEKEIKELQKEALTIEGKEVETLSDFTEELKDTRNNSLSTTLETIEEKPVEGLSEVLETINNKEVGSLSEVVERIEKRVDPELSKKIEQVEDKSSHNLSEEVLKIKGNEEVKPGDKRLDIKEKDVELEDHLETISPKAINELEKYRDNLSDSRNIRLEDDLLEIEEKKDIHLSDHLETISPKPVDGLEDKRLDLEEKEVELSETRLDISPKDTDLSDVVLDLQKPEDLDLSKVRLDISPEDKELSNTRLDLQAPEDQNLSDVRLDISPEDKELDNTRIDLQKPDDPELSNTRLDISPEDKELSNVRLDLQKPEDQDLSDVRLDISPEDKELSDTRIDLQKPEDQDLSDIRLDIQEKEVGLSDVLLDLLEDNGEWDKERLDSTVIDDPEYSLQKLTDIHEITGLSDIRLDIEKKDVELSDIVVKEPHELDIPLSDIIVKEPSELDIPLSDKVVEEPNELDIPLSDTVIKEPTELDIPLSETVIKEPKELDIPLSETVIKEPKELDIPLSDVIVKEPEELDIPLSDKVVKEPEELDVPLSDKIVKEPEELDIPLSDKIVKEPKELDVPLSNWIDLINPEDVDKLSEIRKLLEGFGDWGKKVDVYLTGILSGTVGQFIPESKVEAYKNLFKAVDLPNPGTVETPDYKLGEISLLGGGLSVSKYLRWVAENTVGKISIGGSSGGAIKTRLINETLRLLVEARDLAEKATESRPFRLPGNSLLGTAAGMASKGITVGGVLGAIGNMVSDVKMKPYNRPEQKETTKDPDRRQKWVSPGQVVKDNSDEGEEVPPSGGGFFKKAINNLKSSVNGDPNVSKVETREWADMMKGKSPIPNADGITNFGMAVSGMYLLSKNATSSNSLSEFKGFAKASTRITTPNKFTSTADTRNYTTLDSNHVWEVIIKPYVGKLNGNCTWLPNIAEIDLENKAAFNVTTHYASGWLPITGYELQHKKVNSKELTLFSGNIYFPIGMELTNELRITFADDSLKSMRRYFELAARSSVYMSNIHKDKSWGDSNKGGAEKLISQASSDPTVIIEGRNTPAHYKNVSFLIDIYALNPQFATISRTQLLCVLKDFVFEGQGETDASPTELAINFSIVGEWPSDKIEDKIDLNEKTFYPLNGNRNDQKPDSLLNNLGGVLSSF